jgi:hypothetical protein
VDRPHERILGTILVVAGVVILLVAFFHAYSLLMNLPTKSSTGPTADFSYSVTGFTVTVTDHSHGGSNPITTTYWQFADGNTSGVDNTSHTYANAGNYNLTLIVEDKDGNAAESAAPIHVGTGASSTGTGSPSLAPGGSIGSVLGSTLGGTLGAVISTTETFVLLVVIVMVGGAILRAGWNLITPKAETIQVRVKPKSLAIEGAGYSAMPPLSPPPLSPPPAAPPT